MAVVDAAQKGAKPTENPKLRLQQVGLRATQPRLLTLTALDAAREPVSHDELAASLDQTAMDRATVYRNLMALTRAGLVQREHGGDRIWRYRLAGSQDGHKSAHPHFSCKGCGDTQCLQDGDVRLGGLAERLGLGPVEITLSGQCARCAPPSSTAHP